MAGNWLDRAIGFVSPTRALERERARFRLARVSTARAEYDGATKSRRAEGWRRRVTDANAEIGRATRLLRETARDMVRNNPHAARAVSVLAANIVGPGITFQVRRNGTVDSRLQAIAQELFETTKCDADGRHDLYGLQLIAARAIVESGACLVRYRQRRLSDRLPLPFQLQVFEPDYLDERKHNRFEGGTYLYGKEFDQIGRCTAYWLFPDHPGSSLGRALTSRPTPAEDVIHCFRADRPGQQHGASWFAPVILRARDFADFEDAELMRQKIAACHVGVVTGESDGEVGSNPIEELEPGLIWHAPEGRDIEFNSPPQTNSYEAYTRVSLRAIAMGVGLPYEALTGDLSSVNFSSGRMGWLEFQRQIANWQWQMFIPQFCAGVGGWLIRAFELTGEDVSGVTVAWTPPRREMINPSEEVKANVSAIRSGQKTLSQVMRESGEDPAEVFAELKSDAERLDQLGLVLDCDPRKVTSVGNAVDTSSPANASGE
jgi:lambda family phage portal protein